MKTFEEYLSNSPTKIDYIYWGKEGTPAHAGQVIQALIAWNNDLSQQVSDLQEVIKKEHGGKEPCPCKVCQI